VVATSVATYIPMINAASADVITVAGSDTTENVMGSILSQLNSDANPTYNVPVYGTSNFTVPGDSHCPEISFTRTIGSTPIPTATAPAIAAPNGSGAGRNALRDYVANTKRYSGGSEVTVANNGQSAYDLATGVKGCVDVARSSAFSSNSPATTKGQYYAFALDAVSWASPSTLAPSTLTIDQLQKIYNCTYTNWNEVGGSTGPIQRYLPQSSSGTRSYFLTDLLGNSAANTTATEACPAIKVVDKDGNPFEENRGDKLPTADLEKAVLPYSVGQWVYQANNSVNPSIDQRVSSSGVTTAIKGINRSARGKSGNEADNNVINNSTAHAWNTIDARYQLKDAGWQNVDPEPDTDGYPVVVGNTTKDSGSSWDNVAYPGVRLVYNVLHTDSPSYLVARGLVGFNNVDGGAKSTLCSGGFKTTIVAFGFSPLTSTQNLTSNFPGSTCRRYLA
jgi:ABC-type phosphate transport system substrate-binding protein